MLLPELISNPVDNWSENFMYVSWKGKVVYFQFTHLLSNISNFIISLIWWFVWNFSLWDTVVFELLQPLRSCRCDHQRFMSLIYLIAHGGFKFFTMMRHWEGFWSIILMADLFLQWVSLYLQRFISIYVQF